MSSNYQNELGINHVGKGNKIAGFNITIRKLCFIISTLNSEQHKFRMNKNILHI